MLELTREVRTITVQSIIMHTVGTAKKVCIMRNVHAISVDLCRKEPHNLPNSLLYITIADCSPEASQI